MTLKVFVLFITVSSVLCLGESENVDDKSAEDLQELAQFAVNEIYGKTNKGQLPPVEIADVKQQVVSGINFFLTLRITFPDKSVHTCEATIYTQPWKQSRQLLKSNCPSIVEEHHDENESVFQSLPTTDSEVQRVAKFAVEHIEEESLCFAEARLESINNVLENDGVFSLDITVCEWPFFKSGSQIGMPHPCALAQNLHDCHAVVYTENGVPQKLEHFDCSDC